jgi:hypothetical protein
MRAVKLDPAMLLGFRIVSSQDQEALLTSGVLNSPKIGDKLWPTVRDDLPEVAAASDAASRHQA